MIDLIHLPNPINMKKLLLLSLCLLFALTGLNAQVLFLNEDFGTATGSTPPVGWTQNLITGDPTFDTWRFNNPGGRILNAPISDPAAIFDSDFYSDLGGAEDVALESPVFNTTGSNLVLLEFDHFFLGGFAGAYDVEVFDGTAWVSVLSGTTTTADPQFEQIDISAQAANRSNVQVRFRWTGDWSFYWILDNVVVSTPGPDDLGVTAIDPITSSCSFGPATPITVTVENFGSAPQDTFDIAYSINGGTPVVENITGPNLMPGMTRTYTFTSTADFSVPGNYQIDAYTLLTGDGDLSNDTASTSFDNLGGSSVGVPYLADFDSFPVGTTGTLANGWTNGTDGIIDDLDWFADTAGTVSGGTGPAVDHTQGTNTGVYLYTEASFPAGPGDVFSVFSPCIDLGAGTQVPFLSYWYHMAGGDMGSLEVFVVSGGVRTRIDSIGGPQQANENSPWQEALASLAGFSGLIQLEFRGTIGPGFESDIAIDDVSVFFPPSTDLEATAIIAPTDTSQCFTANETLTLRVANVGVDTVDFAVDPATVTLVASGANAGTFTTTLNSGTLLPLNTLDVDVNNVDLSVIGLTNVSMSIDLPTDGDQSNDTTTQTYVTEAPETFPYSENFDTFIPGEPGTFANGWENSATADREWWANTGTTTSTSTGPDGDNTTGTGVYLYTETSSPTQPGDVYSLLSPCVDLAGSVAPTLSYFYHMYGEDMGTLEVFVISNGVSTRVDSIGGEQQTSNAEAYRQALVDLSAFSGVIQLEFRGTKGADFNSDMAIDDVSIDEAPNPDLGLVGLETPSLPFGCFDTSETVRINFSNFGGVLDFAANPTILDLTVSGANTGTYSQTISSGQVGLGEPGVFEFTGIDLSNLGASELTFVVVAPIDTNLVNDTLSIEVVTQPVIDSFPYIEDFESGRGGWVSFGENSSWDFGTPAKNIITGAFSGVNAWTTGGLGTSSYNPNENSAVYSPCFDMTNAPQGVNVAMKIWIESEFSWDGTVLQSSVDSGRTWVNVGDFGDDFNWYNDTTIDGEPGGQQIGWSGTGFGSYIVSFTPLDPSLVGMPDVRFRVAFGSDGSVQEDGFAFDDFALAVPPTLDLGPDTSIVCIGDSLDTNIPDALLYGWSTGDTTQSIDISNATGTAIEDSTIDVVVLDQFGFVAFDTITINIPAELPPTVSGLTITDVACFGDSTGAIDIEVSGEADPFSYVWSNGATTQDLTSLPAGAYIGTITDTNGCVFVSPALTVAEPTAPLGVAVDTIQDAGCPDDTTGVINITVDGGTAPYSYLWDNGATTQDLTVPGGVYVGTITDANGCELVSPPLTVGNTDTLPESPNIEQVELIGSNVTFNTDSTDVISYTWDFGDGSNFSTERNPTHTYVNNGDYVVSLTVTNECGSTTSTDTVFMRTVGIADLLANSIKLFPNPSNGQFGLSFDNLDMSDVALRVSNLEGQIVYQEELGTKSGSFTHQVRLPMGTARGIYLVQIQVGESLIYKRMNVK